MLNHHQVFGYSVLAVVLGGLGAYATPPDPAETHDIPPFTVPAAKPETAYERFIVIGDQGTGRADQARVAKAMAERAGADGLDFIVTTGDNIYQNGVTSADDPQWKSKFENVYADSALRVPFYPALGNHDHRGDPQAQVAYRWRNPYWRMGGRHYSFERVLKDDTRVAFFVLDTNPILEKQEGWEAQVSWLEGELRQSRARWKIVVGHHPLYSSSTRPRWSPQKPPMRAAIESILVKHKVDLYFCGHDHSLEMHKPVAGVHHVVSGSGAGPDKAYAVEWTADSYYVSTGGGFVLCRVSRDEILLEFVRMNGKTQYAHTLRK